MKDGDENNNSPIRITDDMLETGKTDDKKLIDFETGISFFPTTTLLLIAINILAFIWEISSGALASTESIIKAGALTRSGVLEGEFWRLFSAIVLHADFNHLLGNCICLYVVGMACEHAYGAGKTALFYVISGLSGSLLSITFQEGPSVGASGSIFGMIGVMAVFFLKHKSKLFIRYKQVIHVFWIWGVYSIATSYFIPLIDNWGHVGGFASGIFLAFYMQGRQLPR